MLSESYFAGLIALLTALAKDQAEAIERAGHMVADAIAGRGVVHTFGSGHSHMIAEEAFFRAGGLGPVSPILDDALIFLHGAIASTRAEREPGYAQTLIAKEDVRPVDVAIVISNSGRNAVPIEMAQHFLSLGVRVIAITNPRSAAGSASRHSSGKYLYQLADLVIDNGIPVGDALLSLPGLANRIGPSSTVAGAAIVNAIMIEAAARLQTLGLAVPVIASANVGTGALSDMQAALSPFAKRVRLFNDV